MTSVLDIALDRLSLDDLQEADKDDTYQCELSELMTGFESDKGAGLSQGWKSEQKRPPNGVCHNYTFFYDRLFSEFRSHKLTIFEMGVGVPQCMASWAGSLRGWKEYFPDASIFAADIDREWLYQGEGIQSFYCDQEDPESIQEMWTVVPADKFDIIIDDGPHTYKSNYLFYTESIHKLLNNGVFIIEDVSLDFLDELVHNIQEFNQQNNIHTDLRVLRIPYPSGFTHPSESILKMNNLIILVKKDDSE